MKEKIGRFFGFVTGGILFVLSGAAFLVFLILAVFFAKVSEVFTFASLIATEFFKGVFEALAEACS